MHLRDRAAVGAVVLGCVAACTGEGVTPRAAPREHFVFHDERGAGSFTIQRWVNEASPEVSPSGMCECITVAYLGARRILTYGEGDITAVSTPEPSGKDINGDGRPELIFATWSGGAHCCYQTTVYSVGKEPEKILELNTGDDEGLFADLDGDGRMEFVVSDTGWGTTYCSFAESPFPPVVFAFDPVARVYVKATPRYGGSFSGTIDAWTQEAETKLAEAGHTPDTDKCIALQPALALMYTGRFDDGVALLRRLYLHPDVDAFVTKTTDEVRASSFWVDR